MVLGLLENLVQGGRSQASISAAAEIAWLAQAAPACGPCPGLPVTASEMSRRLASPAVPNAVMTARARLPGPAGGHIRAASPTNQRIAETSVRAPQSAARLSHSGW